MSKLSPILLIIAGALFFITALTTEISKAIYIALGAVFMGLGIAAFRRSRMK